jgi:protein O-GlcNAc transferase
MSGQSSLFTEAIGQFTAGKMKEAEEIFSKVIKQEPKNSEALHMLGLVALQTNRLELARDLILKAISINGKLAGYYSNLALVLRRLNRKDDAAICYKKAIDLSPDMLAAHHGLFTTLNSIVSQPPE